MHQRLASKQMLSLLYWVGALCVTVGVLIFCHWPEISRPYYIYPDVTSGYVFNIMSLDPLAHTHDRVAAYFLHYFGWFHFPFWYMAVSSLVHLGFPIKETLVFSSFLQGVAVFVLLFYAYRNKESAVMAWGGALIFAVFALSMDSLYGGQARGYAFFTTLLFFFAYLRRNMLYLALAFVWAAGFYLPIIPAMGSLFLAECIERVWGKGNRKDCLWAWIVISAVALYILYWVFTYYSFISATKHMVDYKYIFPTPLLGSNYQFGGPGLSRGETFDVWNILMNCVLNFNEHGTAFYVVLMTIFIGVGVLGSIFVPTYRQEMRRVYVFIAVHIGFFLLISQTSSPILASRVCVVAIPIAFAYMGIELLMYLRLKWLCLGVSAAVLGCLLLWCPHNNARDFGKYKNIYKYLSAKKMQGEKGVVAGSLSVVESIPFFTHWDASYLPFWAMIPHTKEMSAFLVPREKDLFFLLYGGEAGSRTLESFVEKYNVRYFIFDEAYLNKKYVGSSNDSRATAFFFSEVKAVIRIYNPKAVFPLMDQAKKIAVVRSDSAYLCSAEALRKAVRFSWWEWRLKRAAVWKEKGIQGYPESLNDAGHK